MFDRILDANSFYADLMLDHIFMQLSPLTKTKRSSSGKSFPPLGPDTKVFVVWVERFDDIGRNVVFKLKIRLKN